jgi:nonspecific dipeptidase
MVDLVSLLNELVDAKGKILIPGIYDAVTPLTDEERTLYEPIDFDLVRYKFENKKFSNQITHYLNY